VDIIQLEGEDQRLYFLVAHLTMHEEVLKYNLNYPYQTSSDHLWFVAVNNNNTLGFIPVKRKEGIAKINNYYVAGDNSRVFSALLKKVVNTLSLDFELEAVVQLRHIPDFKKNGFSTTLFWKRYAKMKVFKNEKERL
jgi:hypothetical protein